MFDRLEAFAHRQFEVLGGDVILPVDKGKRIGAAIMGDSTDHAARRQGCRLHLENRGRLQAR